MSDKPKELPEIQDFKPVWVAWTNTDLTEGRGFSVPYAVAESYEAAVRLGRKGSVMGSDCDVSQCLAVKVNHSWLVPGRIMPENEEDKKLRKAREAKEAALEKAKAAGLSEDDIAALIR